LGVTYNSCYNSVTIFRRGVGQSETWHCYNSYNKGAARLGLLDRNWKPAGLIRMSDSLCVCKTASGVPAEQLDELLPPLMNQRYSSRFFNSQGTEPVVLVNPLLEASSLLRITVEKVMIDCN